MFRARLTLRECSRIGSRKPNRGILSFSAREIRVAAIQHRDASPAAQAAAAPGADKPRTFAAEVAPCPNERHPLLDGFPLLALGAPRPEHQYHHIGFRPHTDAT